MAEKRLLGLKPFIAHETKYLILGSFPSIKSLLHGFYYMNPRNRFFKTLSTVFDEEEPITIPDRKAFLDRHGISLFDMIKSCSRNGSLDSNIKNPELNSLVHFFDKSIKIGCTGKTSYNLFKEYYPEIDVTYLPSPSPANSTGFHLEPYFEFFSRSSS